MDKIDVAQNEIESGLRRSLDNLPKAQPMVKTVICRNCGEFLGASAIDNYCDTSCQQDHRAQLQYAARKRGETCLF